MRKNISKSLFVNLCFGLIGLGVLINGFAYWFLIKELATYQQQIVGALGIGCIIIGFGMGLANSRNFKIKDYD
jgi:hypothetical protein